MKPSSLPCNTLLVSDFSSCVSSFSNFPKSDSTAVTNKLTNVKPDLKYSQVTQHSKCIYTIQTLLSLRKSSSNLHTICEKSIDVCSEKHESKSEVQNNFMLHSTDTYQQQQKSESFLAPRVLNVKNYFKNNKPIAVSDQVSEKKKLSDCIQNATSVSLKTKNNLYPLYCNNKLLSSSKPDFDKWLNDDQNFEYSDIQVDDKKPQEILDYEQEKDELLEVEKSVMKKKSQKSSKLPPFNFSKLKVNSSENFTQNQETTTDEQEKGEHSQCEDEKALEQKGAVISDLPSPVAVVSEFVEKLLKKNSLLSRETLNHAIQDCYGRFILNLPQQYLSNHIQLCFAIQEAYWWYDDYWFDDFTPYLPKLSMRNFGFLLCEKCPLLRLYFNAQSYSDFMLQWRQYCQTIPLKGAILINNTLTKVLMVKGWKGGRWMFPRGKVDELEDDVACAVREVREEIGVDVAKIINNNIFIETNIDEQPLKLFLIPGVLESTPFGPRKRKEISRIEWMPLTLLPGSKKSKKKFQPNDSTEVHKDDLNNSLELKFAESNVLLARALGEDNKPLKFWNVTQFTEALSGWIQLLQKGSRPRKNDDFKNSKLALDLNVDWQRYSISNNGTAPLYSFSSPPKGFNSFLEERYSRSNNYLEDHTKSFSLISRGDYVTGSNLEKKNDSNNLSRVGLAHNNRVSLTSLTSCQPAEPKPPPLPPFIDDSTWYCIPEYTSQKLLRKLQHPQVYFNNFSTSNSFQNYLSLKQPIANKTEVNSSLNSSSSAHISQLQKQIGADYQETNNNMRSAQTIFSKKKVSSLPFNKNSEMPIENIQNKFCEKVSVQSQNIQQNPGQQTYISSKQTSTENKKISSPTISQMKKITILSRPSCQTTKRLTCSKNESLSNNSESSENKAAAFNLTKNSNFTLQANLKLKSGVNTQTGTTTQTKLFPPIPPTSSGLSSMLQEQISTCFKQQKGFTSKQTEESISSSSYFNYLDLKINNNSASFQNKQQKMTSSLTSLLAKKAHSPISNKSNKTQNKSEPIHDESYDSTAVQEVCRLAYHAFEAVNVCRERVGNSKLSAHDFLDILGL